MNAVNLSLEDMDFVDFVGSMWDKIFEFVLKARSLGSLRISGRERGI